MLIWYLAKAQMRQREILELFIPNHQIINVLNRELNGMSTGNKCLIIYERIK